MKAVKRTPRSEMQFGALLNRIEPLASTLAEALEALPEDVTTELRKFVYLSSNIEFDEGEIQWDIARASDDDPTIAAKFLRYMDSDFAQLEIAWGLINARDRPFDEELAPTYEGADETQKN